MGTMLHESITGETAHLFQTPGQSGLEAILISAIPACYKLNCNQLEAGGKFPSGEWNEYDDDDAHGVCGWWIKGRSMLTMMLVTSLMIRMRMIRMVCG